MKHYDLVVIGTGAANIISDAAIDAGLKVAICEKGKFGGTCLTRGCIPTKVLATVSEKKCELEHLSRIGIDFDSENIRLDQKLVKDRVFNKINESNEIADEYREAGADVYEAEASFVSDKIIRINPIDGSKSFEISGDKIVIASGARTMKLDLKGLESCSYLCSETFFSDKYPLPFPKSIIILGGGYIACEFASIFNAFGTEVTLIQRSEHILSKADEDISLALERAFLKRGINLFTSTELLEAGFCDESNDESSESKSRSKSKYVEFKQHGKVRRVRAEEIFLATGVMSNADTLTLENTGIEIDKRGYIKCNEALETSVDGVYCLGDANGRVQLRHKANKEAEILANNLLSSASYLRMDYSLIPAAVFTYPEIAYVGLSEKEAREIYGDRVLTTIMSYSAVAKGYALGITDENETAPACFIKLIVDKENHRIIGVHIIGPAASILIHQYSYLMNLATHEIAEINDIKPSDKLKNARILDKEKLTIDKSLLNSDLDTTDTMDSLVCAHPSLSELAAWAPSLITYEDDED